mgnify:CR=1 FL=1
MSHDEDGDIYGIASSCPKHPHEQQRLSMENGEIVSQVPKNDNVRGAGEYSIVMELYANDGKEEQA